VTNHLKGCFKRSEINERPSATARPVAILDADESFSLEFTQHFLFFGEELEAILFLEVYMRNSPFRPEARVECLQPELLHIMCIAFGVACIRPCLCPFETEWFLPYPHSQWKGQGGRQFLSQHRLRSPGAL
jgi:hypothetical protein